MKKVEHHWKENLESESIVGIRGVNVPMSSTSNDLVTLDKVSFQFKRGTLVYPHVKSLFCFKHYDTFNS